MPTKRSGVHRAGGTPPPDASSHLARGKKRSGSRLCSRHLKDRRSTVGASVGVLFENTALQLAELVERELAEIEGILEPAKLEPLLRFPVDPGDQSVCRPLVSLPDVGEEASVDLLRVLLEAVATEDPAGSSRSGGRALTAWGR
jgi:hypothetical protein